MTPEIVLLFTDSDHVRMGINQIEYEYETSYYHVQKFRSIYSRSRLRALNYIKKNSSSVRKTGKLLSV